MSKSILITNYELINYTGSELNAMSIAKRFKDLGYKVYMLAMFIGEPLCSKAKDCYDEIIDITNTKFNFSNIEFDIVWSHHSFILSWLIFEKKIRAKKIIISSLSARENFEVVPLYGNDLSLVIANSQETKEKLMQEGIKDVYLLENYSFKKYFERDIKVKKLENIAIVSNHVPEELIKAKEILKKEGYKVTIYGFEGKRELITDKVLEQYDVIITIGKTVQYAMSLKIPVYVYDIFGGEGYLTLENIEKNRNRNFSGRGFKKKNPDVIYKEITENFEKAVALAEKIKEYAFKNFCFENNIDKVYKVLDEKPELNLDKIREKYKNDVRKLMTAMQMFINMHNKYLPKLKELNDKEQEITNLNIRLKAQEEAKENIRNEYLEYRKIQENKLTNKIEFRIKKIFGGNNE